MFKKTASKIKKNSYFTTINFVFYIMINRYPQISRLAKSRKIKLKKTVRNMFLNQIKHINVGFDSRTTREFL